MSDPNPTQPCLNCQGGIKHLGSATLMTWLGNDLITVPNFPAWICDFCHQRTFDSDALAHLSMLLNPEAGTPIQPVLPTIKKENPSLKSPPPV